MFPPEFFEDSRTDGEKKLDRLAELHRAVDSSQGLVSALMSLAVIYKKEGLPSCANDIIESAMLVRRDSVVMTTLFTDMLDDYNDKE